MFWILYAQVQTEKLQYVKREMIKRKEMEKMKRVFLVLIIGAWIAKEASAAQQVVGGSQGWVESADLNSWASGRTFKVGDQLVFKYTSGLHSVVELPSESAYKNCDLGTAKDSMNSGNDVVKLDKPGTRYFACGTLGHCGQGMKLKITTVPTTPESSTSSSSPTSTSRASSAFNSSASFVLLLALLATTLLYMF